MSDPTYVLDASALLALMRREAGWEAVWRHLPYACISAVNLSEVIAKLAERGMPPAEVRDSLAELDLDVRSFDGDQALVAGQLRAPTRSAGLSLGDRACIALAAQLHAIALTTDQAWTSVPLPAKVELVG